MPAVRLAALAVTEIDAGVVVPWAGFAVSQGAFEDAIQETLPGEEVSATFCAAGVAPGFALKLSEVGDAETAICGAMELVMTTLL